MKKAIIEQNAFERLKGIHELSRRYNGKGVGSHQNKLLDLMRSHINEIEELAQKKDEHFLIETGDLLVLCFELLLENDANADEVLYKCFERYEKKLKSLLA